MSECKILEMEGSLRSFASQASHMGIRKRSASEDDGDDDNDHYNDHDEDEAFFKS